MSDITALATALPKCAAACLLGAIEASTCAMTNATCVCYDESLNAKATACIAGNCTVREAFFTKNLTSTSCGIVPTVDNSYVPIYIAFDVITAIAILLRIAARLKTKVPMWWDDFIIAVSFLGCLAETTLCMAMKPHGMGADIWTVPFDDITTTLEALHTMFILYITNRALVRLSIVLFHFRVFGHIQLARRLIRYTFILITACGLAFDFAIIFGCTPISYFWTSWDGQHMGHCIDINAVFWSGAIVVIAIDIWILLMPLRFIMRLQLSLRKKILAAIMFTFGISVIIVSLYRLGTINHFTLSQNPTADFVDVGIWSSLELYVGIICACLPNFHSLLQPFYKWVGLTFNSRSKLSQPPSGRSGGGVGPNNRNIHDEESGSELVICTTTTVELDNISRSASRIDPAPTSFYSEDSSL
ncbi:hypothetical protein F4818DRAFT_437127 [Hypoxylon cercidicola]|nr:hypothetical protein F4818DRAFT_437127 [Hypoxylon cercidicola]